MNLDTINQNSVLWKGRLTFCPDFDYFVWFLFWLIITQLCISQKQSSSWLQLVGLTTGLNWAKFVELGWIGLNGFELEWIKVGKIRVYWDSLWANWVKMCWFGIHWGWIGSELRLIWVNGGELGVNLCVLDEFGELNWIGANWDELGWIGGILGWIQLNSDQFW